MSYHFIGIGGIGMSGLARILLQRKQKVAGSDLVQSGVTDVLCAEGAQIYFGHDPRKIQAGATVVFNSDIREDNPELLEARALKLPILHRSDLLALLMKEQNVLAVTGTHGKTTTTALLTHVLIHAGVDPAFAVGGILPHLKTNAGHGKGVYFVAEADESDGTFLKYAPFGAIVTNIDADHMNHFGTEEKQLQSFRQFGGQVSEANHFFWCGDDAKLTSLGLKGVSYGFQDGCQLKIDHFQQKGWTIRYDLIWEGKRYSHVSLPLVGRHNALNSAAVFGLAISLGISEEAIREAFKTFSGVGRRVEKKGEYHGILVIDDYAHHPTEIQAVLRGIKEAVQERKMIALYQPHRYTRIKDCLGLFSGVFASADEVVVTDLYAAGEVPIPGVTGQAVFKEIQKSHPIPVVYVPRDQLLSYLQTHVRPHDVVATLGAGDLTKLGGEFAEWLKKHSPRKMKVAVLLGGRSTEHEISLRSAKYILKSLREAYYDVTPFYITKKGYWLPNSLEGQTDENLHLKISPQAILELQTQDLVFPVLHGPYGEDGTVQGLLEMLGLAHVGPDHCSAALCMDKALTKKLMAYAGIAIAPFIDFNETTWRNRSKELLTQIQEKLKFPLFVKPVHLGSTIGVQKVETFDKLSEVIDQTFAFDTHLLVENGITGREIEFSVLGNETVTVFPPGEIITEGKVYDYNGKYSSNPIQTTPRAELSAALIEKGMAFVKAAYMAAGCTGMARVDCFLDGENRFILNEINTIPGFTENSLYPKMCAVNGLKPEDLLDRLIILGLHRRRQRDKVCP